MDGIRNFIFSRFGEKINNCKIAKKKKTNLHFKYIFLN